jgi:uncharacterized protein
MMQMYPLAIASAEIRHRRYLPKAHAFETQLTYLWFDPDQLATFTGKSWLWSSNRWNFLTLDERDILKLGGRHSVPAVTIQVFGIGQFCGRITF